MCVDHETGNWIMTGEEEILKELGDGESNGRHARRKQKRGKELEMARGTVESRGREVTTKYDNRII